MGTIFAAGYWPGTYWPVGYWQPTYWGPEYVAVVRGAGRRRKAPDLAAAPARAVEDDLLRAQIDAARARMDATEEQRRQQEINREVADKREYYRGLGLKGVEAKRQQAEEEERKRKEILRRLETGRAVRLEKIKQEKSRPPKSDVAAYLEAKRANQNRMAQLRSQAAKTDRQPKESVSSIVRRLEKRIETLENAQKKTGKRR